MTDDIFELKHLKKWFKKHYKFILIIFIYLAYQSNLLIELFRSFGLNIMRIKMPTRLIFIVINDLVHVISLLLLFKKEITNGLKDFKENFDKRIGLMVTCWMVGCIVMATSSIIISLITGNDVSNNEEAVRSSINIAPLYMLFSCAIVAPILEEMTFRRSLKGFIKNRWIFIMTSGLLFGLLHVIGSNNNPLDYLYIIPYSSMGIAFAYLLSKTENITLPIMIHMVHNFILVIVQILRK